MASAQMAMLNTAKGVKTGRRRYGSENLVPFDMLIKSQPSLLPSSMIDVEKRASGHVTASVPGSVPRLPSAVDVQDTTTRVLASQAIHSAPEVEKDVSESVPWVDETKSSHAYACSATCTLM